jgi:hypothetical protein
LDFIDVKKNFYHIPPGIANIILTVASGIEKRELRYSTSQDAELLLTLLH